MFHCNNDIRHLLHHWSDVPTLKVIAIEPGKSVAFLVVAVAVVPTRLLDHPTRVSNPTIVLYNVRSTLARIINYAVTKLLEDAFVAAYKSSLAAFVPVVSW